MSIQPIDPSIVRNIVMQDCGITLNELLGDMRGMRIVFARAIITVVLRDNTDMSLPDISRLVRGRTGKHSTVLDNYKRVQSGRHDEDASLITGVPTTAMDYARYVWICADEKWKVRRDDAERFYRLGDGPEEAA